jgi:hypothetical protein
MMKPLLATTFPASAVEAARLLAVEPDADSLDTRSDWQWVRLANGDLMLATFPQGDTYFDFEVAVETDFKAAEGSGSAELLYDMGDWQVSAKGGTDEFLRWTAGGADALPGDHSGRS